MIEHFTLDVNLVICARTDLHQVMFIHSVVVLFWSLYLEKVLVIGMLPVGGHDQQMGLDAVEYQLVPMHVLGYLYVLPVQFNIKFLYQYAD